MPAFNPKTTPSQNMGAIAETVRNWPGTHRSGSPQSSFAAVGPQAEYLMANHPLDCRLGERSPLAKLEAMNAQVLLLGVGFAKCTAFHLAEYRRGEPVGDVSFATLAENGSGRQWMTVKDVLLNGKRFKELGEDFEKQRGEAVVKGVVGGTTAKLFSLREAVKFAEGWLPVHRPVGSI